MNDYGNAGQPLTRRELRERAEAERAARESAAPPAAAPPVVTGAAAHAAPRTPPPSRRSLRESRTGAPATPAPVVRAPAGSGGMRSLDSTGYLTPVHETAESIEIRPAVAPSASPPRPTGARAVGVGAAPTPEAPRLSSFANAGGHAQAATATPGLPWATTGASAAVDAAPVRQAAPQSVATPGVPPAFAPPREPAAAFGAPAVAESPFARVSGTDRDESPAVESSPFPRVGAAAATPDASLFPRRAAGTTPEASPLAAVVGGEAAPADFDLPRTGQPRPKGSKDAKESRRPSSYTWLQYIILFVVAVILGTLIWLQMGDSATPNAGEGAHAGEGAVAAAAPHSAPPHSD